MRGGRLKEAKIVRQSRMVKRAYVAAGTGRGAAVRAPNICVNLLSLKRQSVRFEAEVAANLAGPAVTLSEDWLRMVDDAESTVFAVK